MTFPPDPSERLPRADLNRRVVLGIDREEMAAAAGVTVVELTDYEFTKPAGTFSLATAERVGKALETFEATRTVLVDSGPIPTV